MADYAALKKGGFMRQKQKNNFSLRIRVVGGHLDAKQLAKVAEVAEKYGEGYVHLTSRQGVEIPFIKLDQIDEVKAALEKGDVVPGVCGPRVRTITACQGAAICPSGCIDTYALAQELDERYFGRELPHKFKFGVTGCQNNCLKAEENDVGIKGGIRVAWQEDMRANGLVPLGNWHSHPESPSRPSEEDKRLAYDSTASYMILSLMDNENPVLNSFHIEGTESEKEVLVLL